MLDHRNSKLRLLHILPSSWVGTTLAHAFLLPCNVFFLFFLLQSNYIHSYSIFFYTFRHSIPFTMRSLHNFLFLSRIFFLCFFSQLTKLALNSTFKKLRSWHSGPITSWQIDGETMETVTLFSWAPKSLWTVTAAMKLKDTCFLNKKQ